MSSHTAVSPDRKVDAAGHRGLVGSAVVRNLRQPGYCELLLRIHQELDPTAQSEAREVFAPECPDAVIMAAARVGGSHPIASARRNSSPMIFFSFGRT